MPDSPTTGQAPAPGWSVYGDSNRAYLNDGENRGLVGVEGGMGATMSWPSIAQDAFIRKSTQTSTQDESELIAAALEEYEIRWKAKKKKKTFHPGTIQEMEDVDKMVQDLEADAGEAFIFMLKKLVEKYRIVLPTVEVAFHNVSLTTDALVGEAGLQSVGNSFLALMKWMVCIPPNTVRHKILQDANGVLVPGRLTLLLGPPGCGKTSLLKMLSANYREGSQNLDLEGKIMYNGHTFNEFQPRRTSTFVSQHDVHIPSVTVSENLTFAYLCQNGYHMERFIIGDEIKLAHERAKAEGQSDVESAEEERLIKVLGELPVIGSRVVTIMRAFGILHTKDTPVGDSMLRGVSGGERKRVTIAEMLVGPRQVLLLDEISTGLDSATLYAIISSMYNFVSCMKYTALISLLQPPPEVFHVFDDLVLMSEGHIVWNGPIDGVLPFFESLGFKCPPRKDVPSFLQEVTTASGQHDFATPELIASRGTTHGENRQRRNTPLIPTEEIVAEYWKTDAGRAQRALLDKEFDKSKSHPAALVQRRFALRWYEAIVVVTKREFMLVLRDPVLIRGRLIQVTVMGLITGGLFYQLPVTLDGSRNFFGVSFLGVMFVTMGNMPQLAITMANKTVWFKHRDNLFYPPWAHAVCTALSNVPSAILDTAVWGILLYFLVGFTYQADKFFIYYFNFFAISTSTSSLMRLIAHCAPDGIAANAYGAIFILILVLMSGFAITRQNIPDYWIWAYYISPFSWGLRTMVINEMTSDRWGIPSTIPGMTVGEASLASFGFQTGDGWLWGGIAFQFGFAITLTIASSFALKYLNGQQHMARVADEEVVEAARASADQRRKEASRLKDKQRMEELARPSNLEETTLTPKTVAQLRLQRVRPPGPQINVDGVEVAPIKVDSAIPFDPVTLLFRDLRYYVPNPSYGKSRAKKAEEPKSAAAKPAENGSSVVVTMAPETSEVPKELELLKGISGYTEPGQLTALMGGSGAGKTTLMDCIAGRKTVGKITGEILVNGHPKVQKTWSRSMGYVEQMDIHTPSATVTEALHFSARLRLPREVSDKEVTSYVDEVVDIVDLSEILFDLIGVPGVTGLSTEQRKRTTIAIELVANPSVVFMDEPTSGLDARAASIVMRAVRNVALNGRAVIVTIHQPSIEIFEAFDFLLLLQKGGRTAYFGPLGRESCTLVEYLEAVPGCPKMEPGVNPATWMLEVTGGAVAIASKAVKVDWPGLYQNSDLCKLNADIVEELFQRDVVAKQPLSVSSKYAATFSVQLKALFKKFERVYWRTPSYNWTRYMTTIMCALLYGTVYYQAGNLSAPVDISKVQSVMGVIFSSTSFLGMINMMAIMPLLGLERVVFYREQASSCYNPWAYSIVAGLIEIPYLLVQVAFFVCIVYPMVHYIRRAQEFFFYLCMTFLSILFFVSFGSALTYSTPSQQMASVVASGLNFMFNLFNGFVIPFPFMAEGWKWTNRASPTTWMLYGLAADQLGNNNLTFVYAPDPTLNTVKVFMEEYFGYDYDFRAWCLLIALAYIVFLRIMGLLALRYVSFLKR